MYLQGSNLLTTIGDEIWAHELGHNLGIVEHHPDNANLMNGSVGNNNDALTEGQLLTINLSPLIQAGTVTVQPVLVTEPVPVPAALALFALPGLLLGRFTLTRRTRMSEPRAA